MAEGVVANEIPRDVALRLCTETEAENRGKWYKWGAWMCWGCTTLFLRKSKRFLFFSANRRHF